MAAARAAKKPIGSGWKPSRSTQRARTDSGAPLTTISRLPSGVSMRAEVIRRSWSNGTSEIRR
jgi:hypothetical protein